MSGLEEIMGELKKHEGLVNSVEKTKVRIKELKQLLGDATIEEKVAKEGESEE